MIDIELLLGGRLLLATGCSTLCAMTVLGGATGATVLSGFIGFFIQLETDGASVGGRLRTESPRLGGLERLRVDF